MTQETDFDAFWLRFVRNHTKPATQYLHLAGNLWSLSLLLRGVVRCSLTRIMLSPLPALALSRFAHKYVEHNEAVGFMENPSWFLRCELKMALHLIRNTMQAEVERALASPEGAENGV